MNIKHPNRLLAFVYCICFLLSCGSDHRVSFTPEERHEADSVVKTVHSVEGLDSLNRAMISQQNTLGQIITLREWGKQLRNESRFEEALKKHDEGLELAEQAGDTLEWVQALNKPH